MDFQTKRTFATEIGILSSLIRSTQRDIESKTASYAGQDLLSYQEMSSSIEQMNRLLDQVKSLIPCSNYEILSSYLDSNIDQVTRKSLQKMLHLSQRKLDKVPSVNSKCLKTRKYRAYSNETKSQIISMRFQKNMPCSLISKITGIPHKNIVRWCDGTGGHRKIGSGRKTDANMQIKLVKWIQEATKAGKPPSLNAIADQATQLSQVDDFKGSRGWLKNFFKRYKHELPGSLTHRSG